MSDLGTFFSSLRDTFNILHSTFKRTEIGTSDQSAAVEARDRCPIMGLLMRVKIAPGCKRERELFRLHLCTF